MNFLYEKQFNILKSHIDTKSENQKSSHWKQHTKNFQILEDGAIDGIYGFGCTSKNTFFKSTVHIILQRLIFKNKIFKSPWYKFSKKMSQAQDRVLDLDSLRHVFTLDFLDSVLLSKKKLNNVCIIGDGMTNFVSPSLKSNHFKKIISVNLVEVLLSDLMLLNKERELKNNEIGIALTDKDLSSMLVDTETRLICIAAQNAEIISNMGIELFVNIASFQEMNEALIDNYFKIIKSNNAYLYSCNRKYKELIGGEILEFSNYPWGDPQIIIDDICPWHQKYYNVWKFPFVHKYQTVLHRLVNYS